MGDVAESHGGEHDLGRFSNALTIGGGKADYNGAIGRACG